MTAVPADQDLKALWQGQDQETDPMTLEQIHALVGKYDRKARKAVIVIPLAIAATSVLVGVLWMQSAEVDVRIALALVFAGTLVTYLTAMGMAFPQRDPAESAGAFLRRRLQTQLRKARGGWLLFLAPLVPGLVACFVVAFRRSHLVIWAPMPLVAVVAPGLLYVMVRTRSQARAFRADLDELDRLMG